MNIDKHTNIGNDTIATAKPTWQNQNGALTLTGMPADIDIRLCGDAYWKEARTILKKQNLDQLIPNGISAFVNYPYAQYGLVDHADATYKRTDTRTNRVELYRAFPILDEAKTWAEQIATRLKEATA